MRFISFKLGVDTSRLLLASTLLIFLSLFGCKSSTTWYSLLTPKLSTNNFTFNCHIDTVDVETYLGGDILINQIDNKEFKRFRFVANSFDLGHQTNNTLSEDIFVKDSQYPKVRDYLSRGEYLYSSFYDDRFFVILDTILFQVKRQKQNVYTWNELYNLREVNFINGRTKYYIDKYSFSLTPNIAYWNNQIIFPIYSGELDLSGKTRNYMIGTLNLVTKGFDVLDLPLPDFYQQEHLGLLNNFSIFNHSKGVGVAFAMQPVIILTDSTLTVSDTIGIRSVYDTLPPLSFDKKDNLRMRMTKTILYDGFYRGLFYNSAKKHYYIFYQIRQKELREDGLNNTFEDRRCSFIILNENFEKIGEYLLPQGIVNTMRIYPTKNGAYFYSPLTEAGRLSRPNDMLKVEINYE